MYNNSETTRRDGSGKMVTEDEIKHLIQVKAEKHSNYYRKLRGDDCDSFSTVQMAKPVIQKEISTVDYISRNEAFNSPGAASLPDVNPHLPREGSDTTSSQRHRRIGVFELDTEFQEEISLVNVKQLRDKYIAMIEENNTNLNYNRLSPRKDTLNRSCDGSDSQGVDDTFLAPPPSCYCSSNASGASDDEKEKTWFKYPDLRRSGSSDSALGLNQSDEDVTDNSPTFDKKDFKEEFNYPFIRSPYSPRASVDYINVPSKTLIEAKFVPYPLDRRASVCGSEDTEGDDKNASDSRRLSCFTDDGEDPPRFRFWRTPSVVVSDYSDDVVGLTLEDIEFLRNKRKETSSSPDSSVHSSCSNLNYCGSTISNLDAEYILRTPFRKVSDCSTCSTFSGDEDTEVQCQPTKERIKDALMNLQRASVSASDSVELTPIVSEGSMLKTSSSESESGAYTSLWNFF
ncbi:hypothetical protein FQA39_LY06103 [Lamprigera yunnana]|nr:hypothetical protein FQA39_LY06103 [Lamprigera yunnana]